MSASFDLIVTLARLNTWKETCKENNQDIETAQTDRDYLVAQDETLEGLIRHARNVLKDLGFDLKYQFGIKE
jgi:hypothetical protein